VDKDSKPKFDVFRYAYSHQLYRNHFSEEEFNQEVVNLFIKKYKAKETGLEKQFIYQSKLQDNLGKDSWFPIIVNHLNITTRQGNYVIPADFSTDYISNLSIFNDIPLDNVSEFGVPMPLKPSKDIVFMGDLVIKMDPSKYLFLLDLISTVGIYSINLDQKCEYILRKPLVDMKFPYTAVSLGTLVNSPGPTSCLIETSVGTKQLVELKENDLVFIPLENMSVARIVVKGQSIGSVDTKIRGGVLGVVIDTRYKSGKNSRALVKSRAVFISRIKEGLSKI